jgi:hypothetical protein
MKFTRHEDKGKGFTDWFVPVQRGYKMMCCDCGLVHRIDFRVTDRRGRSLPGVAAMRVKRDSRSTGAARRNRTVAKRKEQP